MILTQEVQKIGKSFSVPVLLTFPIKYYIIYVLLLRRDCFGNEPESTLKRDIMTTIQLIASTYRQPVANHCAKDPSYQISEIAKAFGLSPDSSLRYFDYVASKWNLAGLVPSESLEHTQLFAWPSVAAIAARHFPNVIDPADRYCRAVLHLFDIIGKSRPFYNSRGGQITPSHLRQHERTFAGLRLIESQQGYVENGVWVPNPILIVPAQFGMRHVELSVEDASLRFIGRDHSPECLVAGDELGLGTLAVGSMALTHPERYVKGRYYHTCCPGDESDPNNIGAFCESPRLYYSSDGELRFDSHYVSYTSSSYGSVTGFIPPG